MGCFGTEVVWGFGHATRQMRMGRRREDCVCPGEWVGKSAARQCLDAWMQCRHRQSVGLAGGLGLSEFPLVLGTGGALLSGKLGTAQEPLREVWARTLQSNSSTWGSMLGRAPTPMSTQLFWSCIWTALRQRRLFHQAQRWRAAPDRVFTGLCSAVVDSTRAEVLRPACP